MGSSTARRVAFVAAISILPALSAVAVADSVGGQVQRMVRVHGCRLHAVAAGNGAPVVVFENGLGEDLSTWDKVRPAIAGLTLTFAYDRAGLGKSDDSPNPRTLGQIVADLHALLKAANVPSPYILVGHSLGGAAVQAFARQHPGDVAALILVDPEDSALVRFLHQKLPPATWASRERALAQAMPDMSPGQRKEYEAFIEHGQAQPGVGPLPHVPIVLLTGTKKNPEFPGNPLEQDLKLQLHDQLVVANPQIQHVLVPESRHYIQADTPQTVIAAIRQVLAQVRRQ
jgi:pimeloyl-ACP methyl ester carboxylesterase